MFRIGHLMAETYQIQIRNSPAEDWCPIIAMKGEVLTESRWNNDRQATAEQATWVRRYLPSTEVRVIERTTRTQTMEL